MKLLRRADEQLISRHGAAGLAIVRAVLVERQRRIGSWTPLFRCCLDVLATVFGFANSTRRGYRPKFIDGEDPGLDPGRHAVDGELVDLRLRRGRANGAG
jgi:hypothetical protein